MPRLTSNPGTPQMILKTDLGYCLLCFSLFTCPTHAIEDVDVAIIGAGISGLTAAYELEKHGIHAQIFEASDRIGGRISSKFSDQWQMPFEVGGTFINSNHHELLGLLQELKVPIIHTLDAACSSYFQIIDNKLSIGESNFDEFIDIIKNLESLRCCPNLSGLELLSAARASPKFFALVQESIRNEYGADLCDVDAQIVYDTIDFDTSLRKFAVDGKLGDEAYILTGGSNLLLNKLLSASAKNIKLSHELRTLGESQDRYILDFVSKGKAITYSAKFVIVTIPLPVIRARVSINLKSISEGIVHNINNSASGKNQKLFLLFDKPVWKNALYGKRFVAITEDAWIWENGDDLQSYPFAGLTVFMGGSAVARLKNNALLRTIERTLLSLSLIVPDIRGHYKGYFVGDAWHANRYSLGSYSGIVTKGQKFLATIPNPCINNFCFAGEGWADDENRGYMNGAVKTAQHAVKHLLSRW